MLKKDAVKYCDECKSAFFPHSSEMMQLCPECAHHFYGYPPCQHVFTNQRCSKCGWDGSRSNYLKGLLESNSNEGNEK